MEVMREPTLPQTILLQGMEERVLLVQFSQGPEIVLIKQFMGAMNALRR
jgi:hypothetical protein